jgi:hypothetical protein
MSDVQFERVDAAWFVLFDLPTGSKVGSARVRKELFELLEETRQAEPEHLRTLLVVAVDDKGQRMGSWPASELLANA